MALRASRSGLRLCRGALRGAALAWQQRAGSGAGAVAVAASAGGAVTGACDGAVLQLSRGMVLGANHTAKWMQTTQKLSPMELINAVPPIQVPGRIVACNGGPTPSLGHPVEFINLDAPEPAVCKYCGLRYEQQHHH